MCFGLDRHTSNPNGYLVILNLDQTHVYDANYIPLNLLTTVDVNYRSAFAATGTYTHKAAVISGF